MFEDEPALIVERYDRMKVNSSGTIEGAYIKKTSVRHLG